MSNIIQTTTKIIKKQNVSKDEYTAHLIQYKSDVANIHDNVNKTIGNQGNAMLNSTTILTRVDFLDSPLHLKTSTILMIIQVRSNQEPTLSLTKHTWLHRQQKIH